MTKLKLTLAALAIVLVAAPPLLAADPQKLQGEFIWERSDRNVSGPLEAVFEPTGDETWNVSFYFSLDDEDHVYSGTAEGSLTEGELRGRVMTDGEKPAPFEFEGKFVEGSFQGTHAGLRDGKKDPTGTMTLSR